MKSKEPQIDINSIPASERTTTVLSLLSLIEMLQNQLAKQSEQLNTFVSEIKRLKKLNLKPKIRPSKLPKQSNDEEDQQSPDGTQLKKRAGSKKRKKSDSLKITHEEVIQAKDVPSGARQKGYQNFIIQELVIKPIVVKYRLERWLLADGTYFTAKLPSRLSGNHFGPTLRAYVLHQYHHQCVTQPLLHAQLQELGFGVSKGQLAKLLIEGKDSFHEEKASILKSGLSASNYIHVDDTGARHQGVNGYCTHIGNELFAWFKSTQRKTRTNFLELLSQGSEEYCLTSFSFVHMKKCKVPPWIRTKLSLFRNRKIIGKEIFEKWLIDLKIKHKIYARVVTEAALIGGILNQGFSTDTVIVSDDAGQFNVFQHSLCWIHAERGITSLIPGNALDLKAVDWARGQIWDIYHLLLDYKKNPSKVFKKKFQNNFRKFCKTETGYLTLNLALKRLYANRHELLLVLKRPDIPLHNNISESDIREYVKRRKLSGLTRCKQGRQCRDTFASQKKTANKLGVGFWTYLLDRIEMKNQIPALSLLIEQAATT
tara:strand:- start:49899 stop:51521 length:1623 start_codon:yes stop_codon:yes gene_type:complete